MPMFYNLCPDEVYTGKKPDVARTIFKDTTVRDFRIVQKEREGVAGKVVGCIPAGSEDVSNLLTVIDYLYKYAFIDLMTGLKNRNAYEETVRFLRDGPSELNRLRVVMIDIDGLKSVNDNYGHDCGDEAIRKVGKSIARAFGAGALNFRCGGDEFICLGFNDMSQNVAKFNQLIRLEKFSVKYPLSASVGVAEYDKAVDTGIDSLIKRCDNLMYLNKRSKKKVDFEVNFNLSVCTGPA